MCILDIVDQSNQVTIVGGRGEEKKRREREREILRRQGRRKREKAWGDKGKERETCQGTLRTQGAKQ